MSALRICQNQENPLNIGGDIKDFGVPKFVTLEYFYLFSEALENSGLKSNETALSLNLRNSSPKGFGRRWPLIQRIQYLRHADLRQI